MTDTQRRDTVPCCDRCGWTGKRTTPALAAYSERRHSCAREAIRQATAARAAARRAARGTGPKVEDPRYGHGTHACYVFDRCRCLPCLDAVRDYEAQRARDKLYGRPRTVPADAARAHVLALGAAGMGRRLIAARAGLSPSILNDLLYGKTGRKPTKRLTPRTEQAILSVRVELADGALIPGHGTTRRLQALVAAGWSQQRLADHLGMLPSNFARLLKPGSGTTVRTAALVRDLYDRLWTGPPATQDPRLAAGITRARTMGRQRGWALPLAWDDDTIDDPAATPAVDEPATQPRSVGRPRTLDLIVERVEELVELGARGPEIAARLNTNPLALGRALYRATRADLAALVHERAA